MILLFVTVWCDDEKILELDEVSNKELVSQFPNSNFVVWAGWVADVLLL